METSSPSYRNVVTNSPSYRNVVTNSRSPSYRNIANEPSSVTHYTSNLPGLNSMSSSYRNIANDPTHVPHYTSNLPGVTTYERNFVPAATINTYNVRNSGYYNEDLYRSRSPSHYQNITNSTRDVYQSPSRVTFASPAQASRRFIAPTTDY
jgi:hypothetical protein